jgi:60S ribosome subunit biogenesis protein NIP7
MFRGLKKQELTLVRRGFDYWGAFDLIQGLNLLVRQGEKAGLYAATPEVRYFAIGREPAPEAAGLYLGEVRKKQFVISLEGAFLVARVSDRKKVKVTGQAESLVLYGRDVFGTSITWADDSIGQNEQVIIANKYGDAIGLGRARYGHDGLFADRVTVTTEADVGMYIREQGLEPGSPACRR